MGKTDTAMTNEVLCKFLCHNLTCLIQEQETLGTPIFWQDEPEERDDDILPMEHLQHDAIPRGTYRFTVRATCPTARAAQASFTIFPDQNGRMDCFAGNLPEQPIEHSAA